MRKLIVSINSTANDIVTGSPSGDPTLLDWSLPYLGPGLESFRQFIASADTFLLGRGTYEDLVRKWPNVKQWPNANDVTLRIGEKINTTPKVVVTGEHPSEGLSWGEFEPPTPLTGTGTGASVEEQIKKMKEGDGGAIITFGSPKLVQSLTNAGLVDEYRLTIFPVIAHEGGHLFENLKGRFDFRVVDVTTFENGVIIVTYAPR